MSQPAPVSAVQAESLRTGTLPPVEQVRPGVWTLGLPFAAGVPDATLAYVIEGTDGVLALVDPGWGDDRSIQVLHDGLRAIGRRIEDVGLVAVTHLHVDHLGAAGAVRAVSGAAIAMHGAELLAIEHQDADRAADEDDVAAWGLPEPLRAEVRRAWGRGRSLPAVGSAPGGPEADGAMADGALADVVLADGDLLPIAGRSLRVLHTPGHTTGHVCFVDEADGLLFTGDHVLPRINSGIGLGGRSVRNPLSDHLASLRLLDPYAALEVCPGHEYRFRDVVSRTRVLARHRVERAEHIAAALDALDRPTMYQVASRVPFRGGIESMTGYLLASALAQTAFHVRELGRAAEVRPA